MGRQLSGNMIVLQSKIIADLLVEVNDIIGKTVNRCSLIVVRKPGNERRATSDERGVVGTIHDSRTTTGGVL